jgi:two-component system response regulator ArlR
MNHVLAVVAEAELVSLLTQRLRQEESEVVVVRNGKEVLSWLCRRVPGLILLDTSVPDIDGHELCRRIRAIGRRPLAVLMLSERAEVAERIKGLESGADDYISKPVDTNELLARIHAGLRRVNDFTGQMQRLEIGDLIVDTAARQVWRSGRLVELTKREYDLLEFMARNAGRVLTRECIFDRVWGWDSQANWEVIKVYMNYLRAKLNAGGQVDLIHAVRGVGYVLRSEDARPLAYVN